MAYTGKKPVDFIDVVTTDSLTITEAISLGDNDEIRLGNGDDLKIYHDGSNSYIQDVGTGNLRLDGNAQVIIGRAGGSQAANFNAAGTVSLNHAGVQKLYTQSTGINVTGTITSDGLTVETGTDPASFTLRNTGNTSGFILKDFNGNEAQLVNADNGPMVFKTNDSERMRIDSSGNVGIGTSSVNSPSAGRTVLEVNGSSQALFHLGINGSAKGQLYHSGSEFRINSIGTDPMTFYANGSERMRITSDGDLVVGNTSSGNYRLRVDTNDDNHLMLNRTGTGNFTFGVLSGGHLSIKDDGTERLRIDSSGNLLVGTTTTNPQSSSSNSGVQIGDGFVFAGRTGEVAILNRQTSDGDIAVFRKDGSTVGSIYTNAADGGSSPELCFASGNTGLKFDDTNNYIRPTNSAGAHRDNIVTLGDDNSRFKDLYLGGSVYLGGTGSANALDDYEEGTWTPVLGGASFTQTGATFSNARYVKIGSSVFYGFAVTFSGTSGNWSAGDGFYLGGGAPFSNSTLLSAGSCWASSSWITGVRATGIVMAYASNQAYIGIEQAGACARSVTLHCGVTFRI